MKVNLVTEGDGNPYMTVRMDDREIGFTLDWEQCDQIFHWVRNQYYRGDLEMFVQEWKKGETSPSVGMSVEEVEKAIPELVGIYGDQIAVDDGEMYYDRIIDSIRHYKWVTQRGDEHKDG